MAVKTTGGALEFDAVILDSNFKAQINNIEKNLIGLTKTTKQQADEVESYAKKASLAIGGYLSFAASTNFIREVVNVRGEFQKLEVSFETMLKSKAKADELMAQAVKLAAITPFTLQDVGSGAKQLLAYGFAQDKVISTLQMLGDVASGVGAPLNDIVYIYGTLQTQGRAYTRDIMQFTQRGIPIIDELAKQYGVTKDKVQELVEAGKVGFPQVEKAFQNLTGSGGIFFNLMEKQSKTLTGQISNLEDAWSRMLNDIGRNSEGALSSTLQFATDAVNNYQKIVDILKVLTVTYGAYRAALIVTSVAQQANNIIQYESALAGTRLTAVQALQSFATKSLQYAWRALSATMLANPFVAVATVLAAITTALIVFSKETRAAKSSMELLKEAEAEVTSNIDQQKASIMTYVSILQSQTVSENERLSAYNKLREIAPDIVKGLTLQQAATADLTARTNEYINSLRQQLKIQQLQQAYTDALKQKQEADQRALALKKSGRDKDKVDAGDRINAFLQGASTGNVGTGFLLAKDFAMTEYQQALVFQKQADKTLSEIENQIKSSAGASTKTLLENDLKRLQAEQDLYSEGVKKGVKSDIEAYNAKQAKINEIKQQLEELLKVEQTPVKVVRNEAFLKAEIQKLTDLRAPFAVASKEYKYYSDQIEKLKNELNPKNGIREQNRDYKEQQSILEDIEAIKRGSLQSGLTKEKSEIDKVNEAYEELYARIKKHNEETKNSKLRVSQNAIDGLRNAQAAQIANIERRQNEERIAKEAEARAKNYDTELSRLSKIYEKYEESKKQFGAEKAREMYQEQIGDNESYLSFLQSEFTKYVDDTTKEGILKTGIIAEAISNTYNAESEKGFERRKQEFIRIFELTADFNQRQKQLQRQYENDVLSIKKEFTGADQERRLEAATTLYKEETKALQLEAIKQSGIYKNLGRDLLAYSKEELTKRIKELKKILRDGFLIDGFGNKIDLTPQMRNDISRGIKDGEQLIESVGEIFGVSVDSLNEVAKYAGVARDSFLSLAQSLAPFNQGLADTLTTMGEIASAAQGLVSIGAGIATGTPMQIIGGTLQLVGSIAGIFSRSRESALKAQKEIEAFQARIIQGEQEINSVFRERERSQSRLNKQRLEGLKDEKDELLKQKADIQKEYDKIFSQLQQQTFVAGLKTEKSGGFLGIGRITKTVEVTQALAGKSFADLEKLYAQNQLTGKAKELFEMLQKIKAEGQNIDALLKQNQEEAKQIFTGTTTDSLIDSIVNAFKEGKRSAADFADDFQEMMQAALLNSLKFQTLEKPLKEFYDKFAELSQSGNVLTAGEIEQLRKQYNDIISNASAQFDNLQQISGIGFRAGADGRVNSLAGAIKGITEQQADLLAGQFGGLRLTAIEQLQIGKQGLDKLTEISNNTAYMPLMYNLHAKWDLTGLKIV